MCTKTQRRRPIKRPTSVRFSVTTYKRWCAQGLFQGLAAIETTRRLTCAIVDFGEARGWYPRTELELGTFRLPNSHGQHVKRKARVDLGLFPPGDAPVVIEIDRTDSRKNLDKLVIGASWGRTAIWIRWGGPRMRIGVPIPDGVELIQLVIPDANDWIQTGHQPIRADAPF